MANNGYYVGQSCSSVKEKSISICSLANPANDYAIPHFRFGSVSSANVQCYSSVSGVRVTYSIPAFDCEIGIDPASIKIPTVADGITLGWQAGAALILVGCILFLKKALK